MKQLRLHEYVIGCPQTKIQSRKSASLHPPSCAIIQLQFHYKDILKCSCCNSVELCFIWFWWRKLPIILSLKFASCPTGWGAHANKRPNLIS